MIKSEEIRGHYGQLLSSTPGQAVKDLAQNTFFDRLPSAFTEKK
jgi:hypothetical protein